MNQIDILIEGYAKVSKNGPASPSQGGWVASSTSTLITTALGKYILVDPGANREKLLQKLEEKGLQTNDIEYVFLTHLHLDHSLLMGIFPKAKIINHESITFGEKGELVPLLIPGTDISIIKTPGHEYAGASLLVPTKDGTVGVVGDVFWFENGEEQKLDIKKKDDFATDMEILKKSRKEVLDLVDWIIPGHGKMTRVIKGK